MEGIVVSWHFDVAWLVFLFLYLKLLFTLKSFYCGLAAQSAFKAAAPTPKVNLF